ncbi:acyl-CoA dehydrogenase [Maribacter sp. CXY002]|uniref:acyl-CoA dehydrogenase n=1 Tax=Maribacter luteocoastalis TaxID=3407671 RepID=UPI003B67151D
MKLFSRRNLDFVLFDVLEIDKLKGLDFFKTHDQESLSLVLDMAEDLYERIDDEAIVEADRREPCLKNGSLKVHPAVHKFVKDYAEAGLIGGALSEEMGGFQIPKTIIAAIDFILCSKSNSFIMFTDLAKGVANVISTFGTEEQKNFFLPNILSGKWLGTMCLTETESGSSLANIATKATPEPNGNYTIKGQKIFISAGDHDITENIVHLVLARIEGAPKGTKGISLFLVPTKNEDGSNNDVSSIGIYHKMGQKATPAMHLEFGANDTCTGYLIGEANKGLNHMFLMMDSARLSVGSMGAGIGSAAYYTALRYAKERKQGKRLNAAKGEEQTEIIHHPDVRRMLLRQKAFVEGTLGFVLQCYAYLDMQQHTDNEEERTKYTRLLNLLTPVAKTYGAEKGVVSVHQAMQVLGGYGYTEDFPLEQLVRDVRILPIYEGTTGIHSLGLLGRQVLGDGGRNLEVWYSEIKGDIEKASRFKNLEIYAEPLSRELETLRKITAHILGLSKKTSPDIFLADATLYMEFFAILNVAWQWLKQGTTVQNRIHATEDDTLFYDSKMLTLQYFFDYEIPNLGGIAERLLNNSRPTVLSNDKELLI